MDDRILQTRVGIMVISGLLLTAILIALFGKFPTPFGQGKLIYVDFPSAPGVSKDTPVRKSGIRIGQVEAVKFIPGTPNVKVTIRLDADKEVFKGERARASIASILGDAVIEIVPPAEPIQHPELVASGDTLKYVPMADPLEMLNTLQSKLPSTLDSMTKAGEDVSALAKNVNRLFEGPEGKEPGRRFDGVLAKTEHAMDNFDKAMASLNELVGDPKLRTDVKTSLGAMPKLLRDTQQAVEGMRKTLGKAESSIEDVKEVTGRLRLKGPQIIDNLSEVSDQLVQITSKFKNPDGTLARLANDPDLYNQLNSALAQFNATLKNVNALAVRSQPVVDNLKVFSDKIARDPSQLGVRGLVERKSPTKYPDYGTIEPPPADFHDLPHKPAPLPEPIEIP